jgi:hypothetical protein
MVEQIMEVVQTCYDQREISVVGCELIQEVQAADNGHDVQVELLLTSGVVSILAEVGRIVWNTVRVQH